MEMTFTMGESKSTLPDGSYYATWQTEVDPILWTKTGRI